MNRNDEPISARAGLKKYLYQGIVSFLVIAASVMFFFLLFRLESLRGFISKVAVILQPIIVGIVIAYLLNPIVNYSDKKLIKIIAPHFKNKEKTKGFIRYISIFISLLIFIFIIYILGNLIIPELYVTIVSIIKELPKNINHFTTWIENFTISDEVIAGYVNQILVKGTQYLETWAQGDLLRQVNTWAGYFATGIMSVLNVLKNLLIGIIVSIYVLSSKEKFSAQGKMIIYALSKHNAANMIIDTIRQCNQIFSGFIVGKLIDSTIIGVLCFVVLSFLDMPYTLLVSVIVGVTNVIPFFGPYIGAIPSAFLILVVSPIDAVYFIIFIIILQQLDGNIIGPKILGESTGLSAFWVVFSILLGGGLFGLMGMLIGVPTFAVIYYIIGRIITHLLDKKNLKKVSSEYEAIESIQIQGDKIIYVPFAEPEPLKEKVKNQTNKKKTNK